jgi:tRNA(fMet)-specific endonuclease VapC
MYLFDTDVLSNIVKKNPSPFLLAQLKKIPRDMQFTSAINIAEISYGAARLPHGEKIIRVFEEKVFPNLASLPFDEDSARVYGKLKARLEKKGIIKSEPDLRIASIAIQHQFTLVTGNTKHFEDIPGLVCENWLLGLKGISDRDIREDFRAFRGRRRRR